ncbi:hypothetical protein [Flagellimonas onchidii]|uniref:hypothetical protein n=1 Tax=Flagellimonas onchidii TaxID=2562684 RepID=UPI0010A63FF2|nr:hypothetical protein [Allomuricauda onchidii]
MDITDNRGAEDVELNGWKLMDGQGRSTALKGKIKSGDSKKIEGTVKGTIKLSNKGGSLMLFDKSENIVDHATWTEFQMKHVPENVAFLFDNKN